MTNEPQAPKRCAGYWRRRALSAESEVKKLEQQVAQNADAAFNDVKIILSDLAKHLPEPCLLKMHAWLKNKFKL